MRDEKNGAAIVLTSWKEIANHLGKSVRTVQRWERSFHLPVRRLDAHNAWIVMAYAEELNSWVRHATSAGPIPEDPEVLRLQERCDQLQQEVVFLRERCSQLEAQLVSPLAERPRTARVSRQNN